jgi:peptide/nickel transport system substrate-binding protein
MMLRSLRRQRWLFVLVLLGGLAGFSALWYATSSSSESVEPDFGGVYIEGMAGTPSRVNPLFAAENQVDESLVALVFAGLTRLDDQGRPFPDLAETWSVSQDGRVYTFKLRSGLTWQDGAPLSADDVVFTYGLLDVPELRASPGLAAVLSETEVAKVDALTLTVTVPRPFAPLPSYLTLGILPAHLLGSKPVGVLGDDPFSQRPVGAGPFKLEELTPSRAVLVANPTYYSGQPYIQRLELRFYRDEGLLLSALKDREVNGALFSALAQNDRFYVEERSDLRLVTLATPELTYVYLNLSRSLFNDRRLRQALLTAIDRDALVTDVLDGEGARTDSALAPGSWAYTPALRRYSFDPSVAGLLLDEAGWPLSPSGVRVRGGQELAVRLSTNSDPLRLAVANEVARRWMALGVRVTVDATGATTLVREELEPRTYEAALFASMADADPDPYAFWHSSQASGKGLNLSALRDPAFDRVIDEARAEQSQPRREELYGQFQELFAQEVPAIPLFAGSMVYVQRESLRGVQVGYVADPGGRFWQVQEWYLRTRSSGP